MMHTGGDGFRYYSREINVGRFSGLHRACVRPRTLGTLHQDLDGFPVGSLKALLCIVGRVIRQP
jgi:hypothetical protein